MRSSTLLLALAPFLAVACTQQGDWDDDSAADDGVALAPADIAGYPALFTRPRHEWREAVSEAGTRRRERVKAG